MVGAEQEAGQLVFDMKSFDADTTKARRFIGLEGTTSESTRSQVNANMRGSDVLDVNRQPTATFDVGSATATGQSSKRGLPTYTLSGTFTLHGVSKPLRVLVEVDQEQGWLHLRGSFAVNQTSFGITPYSKAFGAIGVADPLRIHGDLWAGGTVFRHPQCDALSAQSTDFAAMDSVRVLRQRVLYRDVSLVAATVLYLANK